jgi:hypothetical protein
MEDNGQQETDSVSGGETHDSLGGDLSSLTNWNHLVRIELKDLGHLGDQERLSSLAVGVSQRTKSKKSALAMGDGLLVFKERRKALDDSDGLDKTLGLGEGGKSIGSDLTLLSVLGLDDGINKRGRHSVIRKGECWGGYDWDYRGREG